MSFFGPALVLMTVFLFIPMILTLIYSFTDYFALNPKLTHFIGLENFKNIFKDDLFTTAFGNTIKFVLIIVPLQTLGALGLALLINKVTVCKKYFKVAFSLFSRYFSSQWSCPWRSFQTSGCKFIAQKAF